jgi:HlyD family secretion protein
MTERPMTATASASRLVLALSAALATLAACGGEEPDAYGNFEATEIVVSAEVGGRLLRFEPEEGARLAADSVVAMIDTTALALRRAELAAQLGASRGRTTEAGAQIGVLRAQLATARSDYERVRRLFADEAATAQQLDRARGEVRVLEERIAAARAQSAVVREESGGVEARIDQLDDQIRRSRVRNPVAGTVLATYVEPGELVQPGAPLYKVASLDTLELRAYVDGSQLARLRLGGAATVRVDAGEDSLLSLPGRIAWIASEVEFTPTPIQTRDERVDQVYAVKVRVANRDGVLKIGMPGELLLAAGEERP